ncbi:MAG: acireductone synthase [Gammaproteobacteria bacterium HGW-Gammaproteobacteria-3]|nr:MAG: acireductone synthase [Gammaproteobacteria bacterium HGW-Gammaproteobacteria-3]
MIKAIVTDIEGTTSSLSFVKEVLFPYARAHIGEFVRSHQHKPEMARLLTEVRAAAGEALDTEGLIRQLIRWIDDDRKITPLKSLQGLIWEHGYRNGDFKGHIYPDAVQKLQAFKHQGIDLYVYSSGSVYAQKLLFGHTAFGDLTALFSGYFDTHIGAKQDPESYTRIAAQIALPPAQILFLSDIMEELDAASAAGFKTYWLVREATPVVIGKHPIAADFDMIVV